MVLFPRLHIFHYKRKFYTLRWTYISLQKSITVQFSYLKPLTPHMSWWTKLILRLNGNGNLTRSSIFKAPTNNEWITNQGKSVDCNNRTPQCHLKNPRTSKPHSLQFPASPSQWSWISAPGQGGTSGRQERHFSLARCTYSRQALEIKFLTNLNCTFMITAAAWACWESCLSADGTVSSKGAAECETRETRNEFALKMDCRRARQYITEPQGYADWRWAGLRFDTRVQIILAPPP